MADKNCTHPGCTRVEQLRQGLCKPHYRRFMAFGDPDFNLTAPRHLDLWGRIEYHGWVERAGPLETDCWVFDHGTSRRKGYGCISTRGKTYLAHRVSYEHFVGPIPDGLLVRHRCDNPPCINPKHLLVGTVKDNTADMLERGRANPPIGSKNIHAILDEPTVYEILSRRRSLLEPYWKLAEIYGVSIVTIAFIVQGERWKHVYSEWCLDNPGADLGIRGRNRDKK